MSKAFYHEPTGRIIIRGLKAMPGTMDFKFLNFAGETNDNNANGTRNFSVIISEEDKNTIEEALAKAGRKLNIKEYNGEFYFKIIFGRKFPPEVIKKKVLKSGRLLKTVIPEEDLKFLDKTLMADAELSCTPTFLAKRNTWTCYLNKFNYTPLVDPLEEEEMEEELNFPVDDEEVPFE